MSVTDSDHRVILVTGANKGIGLEAVRLLSEQLPLGTILLGTRSVANGEEAIKKLKEKGGESAGNYSNVHAIQLDVNDAKSLSSAAERVKREFNALDVLINNGAISNVNGDAKHRAVIDTNFYGVRSCVEAFLPILAPNASIITVSSEVGSYTTSDCDDELREQLLNIDELSFDKLDKLAQAWINPPPKPVWPPGVANVGYVVSKALVSAYTRRLALDHPEYTVTVTCPGHCATELNKFSGPRSAAQGADSIIFPVNHKVQTGQFYRDGKVVPYCEPPPKEYLKGMEKLLESLKQAKN